MPPYYRELPPRSDTEDNGHRQQITLIEGTGGGLRFMVHDRGVSLPDGRPEGLYKKDGRDSGSHPAIVLLATHVSPPIRPYQKRTKYRRIYRFLTLLALSNLFRTNDRRVDGDRVKMALYR